MLKYTLFIFAVLVANVAFWYAGGPTLWQSAPAPSSGSNASPAVVDAFIFTLQEEVNKKTGQPIEGYEPAMFLAVFPGLTKSDFAGVDASIGTYQFANGQLRLDMDGAELVHSAAGAVTRQGMETLLYNVGERIGVDVRGDGTLTDVMRYLIEQ